MNTLLETLKSIDLDALFIVVGVLGSFVTRLITAYGPMKVVNWWNGLADGTKQLLMLILFLVIAGGDYFLNANPELQTQVKAVVDWFLAFITSAAVFAGTKRLLPGRTVEQSEALP